jgi:uncharacterized SAM-binding protein YcdF (DUF218 family)
MLMLLALLWIAVWSTPVFSDWIRHSLERRYPPNSMEALPRADVIVVLGGGVEPAFPPRLQPDLGAAADRVWYGARLYHAGKAPRVLVSGGMLPWKSEGSLSEAASMQQFLRALGVPAEAIRLESGSTTTRENALETARLLAAEAVEIPRPARVILVTSALHMRRALASFRAVGIDAVPASTDHEVVDDGPLTPLDLLPAADALEASSRALKEYLGLWVYRRRGWAV